MFEGIKKWWNRHDIRLNEFEERMNARLTERDEAIAQKDAVIAELNAEIQMARKEKSESEALKNSSEPWVDVHSAEFSVERGVQIELDWNAAFISYLKENGFKGKDETIIVQKWLVLLYGDLITRLEEESIEESFATSTTPGEFE